ncbi:hypothetical protein WOLCODRAFT_140208 [Wolfiporia cocos MD-104 SS10]|uniref:Histone chaperone domain-containing protein n=1 Tax=Wolfiporia cocos (strain MD-104) TaxID=742152 RepID=A0A2H3JBF8_WOLCO|nr:hypothetical protein WOLCODRAFT_140208 [Wolfiporia cocos MD-104 SS10]
MSTNAAAANGSSATHAADARTDAPVVDKGKGKFVQEEIMDDDEDDDEEEEEEEEDDDDDMAEDDLEEIDPSAIIGTRRTRGVRVDYTSAAALQKAGLQPSSADDEEGEDSFVAKDDEMNDD